MAMDPLRTARFDIPSGQLLESAYEKRSGTCEDLRKGCQSIRYETVVRPGASLRASQEPGGGEHLEVMRDRRLRQTDRVDEIADARFLVGAGGDDRQQPQPSWIREGLQTGGEMLRVIQSERFLHERSAAGDAGGDIGDLEKLNHTLILIDIDSHR